MKSARLACFLLSCAVWPQIAGAQSSGWDYQPGQGPRPATKTNSYFDADTGLPPGATSVRRVATPVESSTTSSSAWDRAWGAAPVTSSGVDLGLLFAGYDYQESSLDMSLKGPRFGATLDGTYAWSSQFFVRGETRFSYGSLDYKGSGEMDGVNDYLFEARGLGGRDFVWGRYAIAPYTGIGYRYLFNDMTGTTSTGASGYERVSQYVYVPVGVQPKMRLGNGADLSLRLEYDQLLTGSQESRFSTMSAGFPDVTNDQDSGYGLRGELLYQQSRWALGPYASYWNIGASSYDCASAAVTQCASEPHNDTLEYGLRLTYRLF